MPVRGEGEAGPLGWESGRLLLSHHARLHLGFSLGEAVCTPARLQQRVRGEPGVSDPASDMEKQRP